MNSEKVILFNVPGDNSTTFRRDKFKEYYKVYSYFDPSINMLCYVARNLKLDIEDRIWASLIYSATYSASSTYKFLQSFPHKATMEDETKLLDWWTKEKDTTIFQSDRRYVKNNNMFIPIIMDYISKVGNSSQVDFFKSMKKETSEETYDTIYKFTNSLLYYGRFSIFLFMEALHALTGIKMDKDTINWKQGSTTTQGLAHIVYRDDIVMRGKEHKLTSEDCNLLDQESKKLISELREMLPERDLTIWDIESALCGYRKLFKQTRYLSYYCDRELKELTDMTNMNPNIDFKLLWEYRQKYIIPEFLGELNNWKGTRPKYNKVFMQSGQLWTHDLPELEYKDLSYSAEI